MTSHDDDPTRTTSADVSRRRVLGLAAAVAAGAVARPVDWVFALTPGGAIVKRRQAEGESYRPVFFTADELEAVARLCDVIIPRTETPGARDARVHEYLDLDLSIDDDDDQAEFRRGLTAVDDACRATHGSPLHQASAEQIAELLTPLSEEVTQKGDENLSVGAGFFSHIKGKTIFGYYTSREGRVEELGLPETVTAQRWQGCPHGNETTEHGG